MHRDVSECLVQGDEIESYLSSLSLVVRIVRCVIIRESSLPISSSHKGEHTAILEIGFHTLGVAYFPGGKGLPRNPGRANGAAYPQIQTHDLRSNIDPYGNPLACVQEQIQAI